MKGLDHQDAKRYWRIAEVRSSARVFAAGAERGFRERFGELAGDGAQETFGAVGAIFCMTGDVLDDLETNLDKARHGRSRSRIGRRQAFRDRDAAYEAQRGVMCRARQFADSVTGGRGNVLLGVRGPTPRNVEKIAAWGPILVTGLRGAGLPAAAQALADGFADEIEKLTRALDEAIERAVEASGDERLDNAELKLVRETVDAELAKIVAFLRTNLELAGEHALATRVLGKRRGRPRKTRQQTDGATQLAVEAPQEIDSAPQPASEAGRKFDSAPHSASEAGRKFDSAPAEEAPAACGEPREIKRAPSTACGVPGKIVEGPNGACEASEKIAEVLCKPCDEPSMEVEVASFQQDTPRSARERRRGVAAALLGASKRLLVSGWMGRFVSGERRRRRASGRE